MTAEELMRWLAGGPRVLDGAMASELIRRGIGSASRLWGVGALLDDPEAVRALHREHAAAGAEALTAATFRVAPYSLRKAGLEDRAADLARLAVRLAREGAAEAGSEAVVLGSQTTLEDCWRPDLVPDDDTLAREHARAAAILADAGADAILLETLNTAREARIAARAAARTGLAVIVSFACRSAGRLLSGEDAGAAAAAATVPGVVAAGVNCTALRDLMPALVRVAAGTHLPLVAYGNDGFFAEDSAWLAAHAAGPEPFARCMLACAAAGARLVGGCCGTSPAHTAALAAALGRRPTA
jgi:S-methylmethionine-dependent homocysteine/selenocysteine methylase